jgi:hypothetical protein
MKKSLDIKQVDQSSRKKPPKVKKTSEKEEGPFYTQVLYFSLHPHQKSKSRKRFRKRKKNKQKSSNDFQFLTGCWTNQTVQYPLAHSHPSPPIYSENVRRLGINNSYYLLVITRARSVGMVSRRDNKSTH